MRKLYNLFAFIFLIIGSCTVVDADLLELMQEIKNQNKELMGEIKSLQSKSDSLIEDLKKSAAKQEELMNQVTDLQGQLVDILSQLNELNRQLNTQGANIESIKAQMGVLQEQYQEIINQLEQLQGLSKILAEIELLKGQLSELNKQHLEMMGMVGKNQQEIQTIKSLLEFIKTQSTLNQEMLTELTIQLGEQGADINKILAQYQEIQEQLQQLVMLGQILEEIQSLKAQQGEWDQKFQQIINGLGKNQDAINALNAQVTALHTELNNKLAEIMELLNTLTKDGAETEAIIKQLEELKITINKINEKLDRLLEENNGVFFEANGTIKCPEAKPGDKGFVNGKKYEAVDRALLIKRRDEKADLTCVCTSLVTNMSGIFRGTEQNRNTFNQPIGKWDVSNVTNMSFMFFESEFNQSIENWDVSRVTDMSSMFLLSSFNKPIGQWEVRNVTNMNRMFYGNYYFDQPIGNWEVSKVTDMTAMFLRTPFNQDIIRWNVSRVVSFVDMFWDNSKFNQPIGTWDVSSGRDFHGMFWGATSFNQHLGDWDVSNAETMSYMFSGIYDFESYNRKSIFNHDISKWNVKNVKNMVGMFNNSNFNQNISNWCVRNISSEPEKFSTNSPLSNQNKPIWDTCPD